MSIHNIQFHDKIRIISLFVFMSYRKNFLGTQIQVRVSHRSNESSVFELLRFDCII